MGKVYFCSDPHFGHKNLCNNLRNMTVEESDNLIIQNWNSIVTKYDTVYIVGDLVLENYKLIAKYIKQLNGKIRLIGGNHDNPKCCRTLNDLGITVIGCLEYKGYIVTHIPVHPMELGRNRFKGNIHGHLHISEQINDFDYTNYNPGELYFNVNFEFNNYQLVEFSTIEEYFNNLNK